MISFDADVRYSIVLPFFNEEETIPELHSRLVPVLNALDGPAEVICVDDGSVDRTYELLVGIHQMDTRFKVLRLSRNFGHQVAITAGLDLASGDAVLIMDADLQDPPELIFEMIERWREGNEVVYAVRNDRVVEPFLRRSAIRLFYRILRRLTDLDIPADAGDFRLIDRRALEAFRALREHNRYARGLFAWIGFRQVGVPYKRSPRFAGETKYPLPKLVKLAADAVMGFSTVPLRLALACGFIVAVAAFLIGMTAIFLRVTGLVDLSAVQGWASIVVVVSFLGGIQLCLLGMVGLYVGRVYDEARGRPLYFVDRAHGTGADGMVSEVSFVTDLLRRANHPDAVVMD